MRGYKRVRLREGFRLYEHQSYSGTCANLDAPKTPLIDFSDRRCFLVLLISVSDWQWATVGDWLWSAVDD